MTFGDKMNTILAILIAFMACLFGLIAVAAGMLCMGLFGAPGAILYEIGKKKDQAPLRTAGILVAGLGQAFVVGAYCVLAVSLLHWLIAIKPSLPAWPLWFAAVFHTCAIPANALKETEAAKTAQYIALPFASLAAIVTFILTITSPSVLEPVFGWIPWFDYLLKNAEPAVTANVANATWLS